MSASSPHSGRGHRIMCPQCKVDVVVPAGLMGSQVLCPHCQAAFQAVGGHVAGPHSPDSVVVGNPVGLAPAPTVASVVSPPPEPERLLVKCPKCGHRFWIRPQLMGKSGPCKKCGKTFTITRDLVQTRQAVIAELDGEINSYFNSGGPVERPEQLPRVIGLLEELVALDPNNAWGWSNLASLQFGTGRPEDALRACQMAIRLEPNEPMNWVTQAECLEALKRHQEAMKVYDKAIGLVSDSGLLATLYFNRGACAFNVGAREEARQFFLKTLQLNPGHERAREALQAVQGSTQGQALVVGSLVLADWQGRGIWYLGRVAEIRGPQVLVRYLDGDQEWVTGGRISPLQLRPGVRVLARWQGGNLWYPGVVTNVFQERVAVQYLDGAQETLAPQLVRFDDLSPGDVVIADLRGDREYVEARVLGRSGDHLRLALADDSQVETAMPRAGLVLEARQSGGRPPLGLPPKPPETGGHQRPPDNRPPRPRRDDEASVVLATGFRWGLGGAALGLVLGILAVAAGAGGNTPGRLLLAPYLSLFCGCFAAGIRWGFLGAQGDALSAVDKLIWVFCLPLYLAEIILSAALRVRIQGLANIMTSLTRLIYVPIFAAVAGLPYAGYVLLTQRVRIGVFGYLACCCVGFFPCLIGFMVLMFLLIGDVSSEMTTPAPSCPTVGQSPAAVPGTSVPPLGGPIPERELPGPRGSENGTSLAGDAPTAATALPTLRPAPVDLVPPGFAEAAAPDSSSVPAGGMVPSPGSVVPGGQPGTQDPSVPGGYPGAGTPASQQPLGALTFAEKADLAFRQGRERDGFQYLYAHALTGDEAAATAVLGKMGWLAAAKRPAIRVRWGIAIQYVPPPGYQGSVFPIGTLQNLPQRPGRAVGVAPPGAQGPPGFGGPATAPAMMSGGGPAHAAVTRDEAILVLDHLTGELGQKLVRGLQQRAIRGDFGQVLASACKRSGGTAPLAPRTVPVPGAMMPGSVPGGEQAPGVPGLPPVVRSPGAISLSPGIVLLGIISARDLEEKARAADVDAVCEFHIDVTVNLRIGTITNKTAIHLHAPGQTRERWKSETLNNIEIQIQRANPRGGKDPVDKQVEGLFEAVDADWRLSPMPVGLQPAHVLKRVGALIAESYENPLPVLAEIRMYQTRGLLQEDHLLSAYQRLIGDAEGAQLAKGSEKEKQKAIEKWLPGDV